MKFAGLNRFNKTQADKATGLRTGDSVTQAQLAAAVDKLAKSGAFENVSFRYSKNGNSLNVVLSTLVEYPNLGPPRKRFESHCVTWFVRTESPATSP
jgi:outer membrane protein assembly factor BamA